MLVYNGWTLGFKLFKVGTICTNVNQHSLQYLYMNNAIFLKIYWNIEYLFSVDGILSIVFKDWISLVKLMMTLDIYYGE